MFKKVENHFLEKDRFLVNYDKFLKKFDCKRCLTLEKFINLEGERVTRSHDTSLNTFTFKH